MRFAQFIIRKAATHEESRIRTMQEFSLRILGSDFYTPEEIEAFLEEVGTMDSAVLAEGHYFVATDRRGEILGSGGWSRLSPAYATLPHPGPGRDTAMIRSVFVAPAAARRGIGSAIMRRAEADAAAAGLKLLRLTATLSGACLYSGLGYRSGKPGRLALSRGVSFACIEMEKPLASTAKAA